MKASFKCGVCGEKLTLTGTPNGIERARIMWMEGHKHCGIERAVNYRPNKAIKLTQTGADRNAVDSPDGPLFAPELG